MTPERIRAIRAKCGMSQSVFADKFGLNVRTLQRWERGDCFPTGASKTYLSLIEYDKSQILSLIGATQFV